MAVILDVNNAEYSYEAGNNIFEDISFSLHKGEVLSLLGPNGIGKSTLIKCLADIFRLRSGSVSIHGNDISKMKRSDVAAGIGYVPQAHKIVFPFSVEDFVLMGRAPYIGPFASPGENDYEIAWQAIETVGMDHLRNRPVSEISGGEHQLVMIARALAQEPEILLLDEPTSHLDFGNQIKVLTLIDKLSKDGMSVIQSTHFPDHGFLISGTSAIMKNGSIIAYGPVEDVITAENLKMAYGVDVGIHFIEGPNRKVCVPLMNI